MAETKDGHVLVKVCTITATSAMQHNRLMEISQSPGHLLLLKLWQREEKLYGKKMAIKETRIDSIRIEMFQLCCFFFIFHALFLTILFTSSLKDVNHDRDYHHCAHQICWIPSVLSICTSLVIVFLVHSKLSRYWKECRQLQRKRIGNRTLSRRIQELRMMGGSFDLCKEAQDGKRFKSSSVEIKWNPITWFSQYVVTISLVSFTGLLFSATKFMLGA